MSDDLIAPYRIRIDDLQNRLGVKLSQPIFLLEAITHDSFHREISPQWSSNERLEFLGDSVIGMIVSEELYNMFPEAPEGLLAQMKSYLVSAEFLGQKARELNLGDYVLLGRGEMISGGRERVSILADTYEAVLGAIYLDQGLEVMKRIIREALSSSLDNILACCRSPKSLLQERTQKYFKCLPLYTVVREEGPPHQKRFFVRVYFRGEVLGEGSGCSKKEAEKAAADMALGNFKGYLEREFARDGKSEEEEEEEEGEGEGEGEGETC